MLAYIKWSHPLYFDINARQFTYKKKCRKWRKEMTISNKNRREKVWIQWWNLKEIFKFRKKWKKKNLHKKKNIYMPWIVLRTWNGEQRRVGDRLGARNRALGRRSKVFPKVGLVDPATQRPILEGSTGQSLSSATTGWTPAWSILNYYYHYYFNFFVFFKA